MNYIEKYSITFHHSGLSPNQRRLSSMKVSNSTDVRLNPGPAGSPGQPGKSIQGPRGPRGDQGPQGIQGPPGSSSFDEATIMGINVAINSG